MLTRLFWAIILAWTTLVFCTPVPQGDDGVESNVQTSTETGTGSTGRTWGLNRYFKSSARTPADAQDSSGVEPVTGTASSQRLYGKFMGKFKSAKAKDETGVVDPGAGADAEAGTETTRRPNYFVSGFNKFKSKMTPKTKDETGTGTIPLAGAQGSYQAGTSGTAQNKFAQYLPKTASSYMPFQSYKVFVGYYKHDLQNKWGRSYTVFLAFRKPLGKSYRLWAEWHFNQGYNGPGRWVFRYGEERPRKKPASGGSPEDAASNGAASVATGSDRKWYPFQKSKNPPREESIRIRLVKPIIKGNELQMELADTHGLAVTQAEDPLADWHWLRRALRFMSDPKNGYITPEAAKNAYEELERRLQHRGLLNPSQPVTKYGTPTPQSTPHHTPVGSPVRQEVASPNKVAMASTRGNENDGLPPLIDLGGFEQAA